MQTSASPAALRRFEKKVVLVTGAAGGIPSACIRIMAAEGACIAALDRDGPAVEQLVQSLAAAGTPALALIGDATSEADATRAVAQTLERFGRIDVLVNGVGGSFVIEDPNTLVEDLTLAQWQRLVDFNLLPPFLFTRAVTPAMKSQRAGCIVNVSSHAATGRVTRNAGYASAKAGLGGFTRKVAHELGPHGIRCNEVMPGRTRTSAQAEEDARRDATGTAAYLQTIPLRRLAVPEDVARVVCFLASADADYVTGATVPVTGGV